VNRPNELVASVARRYRTDRPTKGDGGGVDPDRGRREPSGLTPRLHRRGCYARPANGGRWYSRASAWQTSAHVTVTTAFNMFEMWSAVSSKLEHSATSSGSPLPLTSHAPQTPHTSSGSIKGKGFDSSRQRSLEHVETSRGRCSLIRAQEIHSGRSRLKALRLPCFPLPLYVTVIQRERERESRSRTNESYGSFRWYLMGRLGASSTASSSRRKKRG